MGVTNAQPFQTRIFLEELSSGKPDGFYILLWTLPAKTSRWFRNVEDAIRFAESVTDQDLYVGVALSSEDYGPRKRCKSGETTGIIGLWADFDLKSDAHAKSNLPVAIEEALGLVPKEFPPTSLFSLATASIAGGCFGNP